MANRITMSQDIFKAELDEKDIKINELEKKLHQLEQQVNLPASLLFSQDTPTINPDNELTNDDISRYSRQLILPEIGPKGQLCLAQSSVLIVGAGGLGCPAAVYLAAAGIGRLGIVDYDEVEISNLHRQILHNEYRKGKSKSASIALSCSSLNSGVQCVPYHLALDSTNAIDIIKQYDVIVDATDNLPTRYLLNDACVFTNKPLVSGSALKFEGQLTIYNYQDGPCYRCLFPKPPPPETVTNCSDGGVLGVVPGIIGCLQALEVIKMVVGMEISFTKKMLIFDAKDTNKPFRQINLRGKNLNCTVCGKSPSITKLIDYEQFCSSKATDKTRNLHILNEQDRISVMEYKQILDSKRQHLLLDVRLPIEVEICKLPTDIFINIPITDINMDSSLHILKQHMDDKPVFVVCRQGNDSQKAVAALRKIFTDNNIKDIKGGLLAWNKEVDASFPIY